MSATSEPVAAEDHQAEEQAPQFVRHDVGRLEYVDPRSLIVDPFNHRKARDGRVPRADARLIASVQIRGVETPLTVRLQEDGVTLGVVKGQRRLLAALLVAEKAEKAGRPIPEVPVLIRDDLVGANDEAVASSMIENTHREAASARDDLEALSLLSEMEITAAQRNRHAKALGYRPAELAAAATVRTMRDEKLAMALRDFDLIEAAEYAEVAELSHAHWNLSEAKRLDQKETGKGKKGRWHWAHALERLRADLSERQRRADLEAELRGNAVTLLVQRSTWTDTLARPLPDLRTGLGRKISSSQHAKTCPHHAAYIDRSTIKAVWMCADWKAAGHKLSEQAAAEEPQTPDRAEEAAKRQRTIANNKAWKAARVVRQQFVTELVAAKTISDAAWVLVLDTITGTSHGYSRAVKRQRTDATAALLGVADPNEGNPGWRRVDHPFMPVIGRTAKGRRGNILLAHVAAVFEYDAMGDNAWRGSIATGTRAWLEFLVGEGYVPSDLEAEVMARGNAAAKNDGQAPAEAEDPADQQTGDDQADGDQDIEDAEDQQAPAQDVDLEAADAEANADEPADDAEAEDPDEADSHAGCIEPHRSADGYVDCDGKPL
jgi:ParB family chromosome partitioning protein